MFLAEILNFPIHNNINLKLSVFHIREHFADVSFNGVFYQEQTDSVILTGRYWEVIVSKTVPLFFLIFGGTHVSSYYKKIKELPFYLAFSKNIVYI